MTARALVNWASGIICERQLQAQHDLTENQELESPRWLLPRHGRVGGDWIVAQHQEIADNLGGEHHQLLADP